MRETKLKGTSRTSLSMHSTLGFTLIELSIVLVIIGLIVGGILVGQSMIRAAELRSVTREVINFTTAIHTFQLRYNSLPGDMPDATTYWGAADGGAGTGAGCGNILSTDMTTCNGNGDGQISTAPVNGVYEKMRAWQQLANAGLIQGSYVGAPNTGGAVSIVGKQWPASRFPGAGYEINYWITNIYNNPPGHFIKIAAPDPNFGDSTGMNGGFLSPQDAQNIDQKIDDGLSDSGRLVAIDSSNVVGCVTNGTTFSPGTTGSYILTNTTRGCRFYFYTGF